MVKNFGAPKLNTEQFQRMMNIIHIESLISGLFHKDEYKDKFEFRYRQSKSLNELTGRKTPEVLYKEMIRLSSQQ